MTNKKINYELLLGFAEKLKRLRENSYITLDSLAKELKLAPEKISNLESANIADYHDIIYLKLAYRNYARVLKLDKEEIAYQLQQIFQTPTQFKNSDSRLGGRPRISIYGLIQVLTLFGIFLYLGYLTYGLIRPPKLEVDKTPSTVLNDNFQLNGKTNVNANIYINNNLASTDLRGNFSVKINLRPGKNLIAVKAVNLYSKKDQEQIIEIQADY